MKKITSAAVALLASAFALGTSAQAQEGTYYDGIDRNPKVDAPASANQSYGYSGSINNPSLRNGWDTTPKTVNSGDYYGGAERPN